MFEIPHKPGSLADAMLVFKRGRLNLTWIESFPSRAAKPEYVFFADFEGHVDDAKSKKCLGILQEHCEKVTILGSFPQAPISND